MKVWESPFIPSHLTFRSFKFHSLSVNQSHNNQTISQNYLFNITFQNLEFWDVPVSHGHRTIGGIEWWLWRKKERKMVSHQLGISMAYGLAHQ